MNNFNRAYFVALLVVLAGGAQAQEIPMRGPIPFAAYDQDANGLISDEEFYRVRGERVSTRSDEGGMMRGAAGAPSFTDLDSDGDGQLTADELALGQHIQMGKRHAMGMGRGQGMGNGMGMMYNMPIFSEYDLNDDGILLESEYAQACSKRITERQEMGFRMRNLDNAPSFADIDSNADGEISPEEFSVHQSLRRQQKSQ